MSAPVSIDPRQHDAVIFDLDGVVTDTASSHAAAWAATFNDFLAQPYANDAENHSPFTAADYRRYLDGKPRLDGVIDFLASSLAFALERREPQQHEDYWLLADIWIQRFTYRQVFSVVLFKTLKRAIDGRHFSWEKLERTAALSHGGD